MTHATPQSETGKPKKKKARYEDEGQILKDITNTRYHIKFLEEEACICDDMAKVMRNWFSFPAAGIKENGFGSKIILSLGEYQSRAEYNRTKASNFKNKKLKKLGEALSQMRTGVFPEIVDDASFERPF